MKKLRSLLVMLFIVGVLFSLSACGGKYAEIDEIVDGNYYENDINDAQIDQSGTIPSTMTDLFDGERKIWFYIDKTDADDGLAYDNEIEAIFVTENKKVTEFYYNLIDSGNGSYIMMQSISDTNPHPFSIKRLMLGDFAGLSDDEVLKKVKESYGDASLEYEFTYNFHTDVSGSFSLPGYTFPYEIKYNGELDASGNNLKSEKISFSEIAFSFRAGMGNFSHSAYVNYTDFEIYYTIKDTEIKDKVYVGLRDTQGDMIVTINNYASFDNIEYDNPDGITEW